MAHDVYGCAGDVDVTPVDKGNGRGEGWAKDRPALRAAAKGFGSQPEGRGRAGRKGKGPALTDRFGNRGDAGVGDGGRFGCKRKARQRGLGDGAAAVGQAFKEFGPRPLGGSAKTKGGQFGRQDCKSEGQGFGLIFGQTGQPAAVVEAKLDSSGGATAGEDGQARLGQGVDVALDRAGVDLKFSRKGRGGHPAPILQEEKNVQKSRGAHDIPDRR